MGSSNREHTARKPNPGGFSLPMGSWQFLTKKLSLWIDLRASSDESRRSQQNTHTRRADGLRFACTWYRMSLFRVILFRPDRLLGLRTKHNPCMLSYYSPGSQPNTHNRRLRSIAQNESFSLTGISAAHMDCLDSTTSRSGFPSTFPEHLSGCGRIQRHTRSCGCYLLWRHWLPCSACSAAAETLHRKMALHIRGRPAVL